MNLLKIDIVTDYQLTPEQVAELFESMSSEEQATFFNHLATNVETWSHPFCFQLEYLTNEINLTDKARAIMEQIGEYAYPYGDPRNKP